MKFCCRRDLPHRVPAAAAGELCAGNAGRAFLLRQAHRTPARQLFEQLLQPVTLC